MLSVLNLCQSTPLKPSAFIPLRRRTIDVDLGKGSGMGLGMGFGVTVEYNSGLG